MSRCGRRPDRRRPHGRQQGKSNQNLRSHDVLSPAWYSTGRRSSECRTPVLQQCCVGRRAKLTRPRSRPSGPARGGRVATGARPIPRSVRPGVLRKGCGRVPSRCTRALTCGGGRHRLRHDHSRRIHRLARNGDAQRSRARHRGAARTRPANISRLDRECWSDRGDRQTVCPAAADRDPETVVAKGNARQRIVVPLVGRSRHPTGPCKERTSCRFSRAHSQRLLPAAGPG